MSNKKNKFSLLNFQHSLLVSCSLATSLPCYGMENDSSFEDSGSSITSSSDVSESSPTKNFVVHPDFPLGFPSILKTFFPLQERQDLRKTILDGIKEYKESEKYKKSGKKATALFEYGWPFDLPYELALDLLSMSEFGTPLKEYEGGSHLVYGYEGAHFKAASGSKQSELHTGMEQAMYSLSHLLFGRGLTPSELIIFEMKIKEAKWPEALGENHIKKTRFDELKFCKRGSIEHQELLEYEKELIKNGWFVEHDLSGLRQVVQASQTVQGISLDELLSTKRSSEAQYALDHIDMVSFSQNIIFSFLTIITDGNHGNYMFRKNNKGDFEVFGIDNDGALGNSIVFLPNSSGSASGKHAVAVKNFLYFLKDMNKPIPEEEVKKQILKIDSTELFLKWLCYLVAQNEHHLTAPKPYLKEEKHVRETKEALENGNDKYSKIVQAQAKDDNNNPMKNLGLPIQLVPNKISDLENKLQLIKDAFNENPHITLNELFKILDPVTYWFHQYFIEKHPNSETDAANAFVSFNTDKKNLSDQDVKNYIKAPSRLPSLTSHLGHIKCTEQAYINERTESPKDALKKYIDNINWSKGPLSDKNLIWPNLKEYLPPLITFIPDLVQDHKSLLKIALIDHTNNFLIRFLDEKPPFQLFVDIVEKIKEVKSDLINNYIMAERNGRSIFDKILESYHHKYSYSEICKLLKIQTSPNISNQSLLSTAIKPEEQDKPTHTRKSKNSSERQSDPDSVKVSSSGEFISSSSKRKESKQSNERPFDDAPIDYIPAASSELTSSPSIVKALKKFVNSNKKKLNSNSDNSDEQQLDQQHGMYIKVQALDPKNKIEPNNEAANNRSDDIIQLIKLAENGDVKVQKQLGRMYYKGYDESGNKGNPNYQEAFKWYKKAAQRGDSFAQYRLGKMYYEGYDEFGHKGDPNYQEAFKWYKKAANRGHSLALYYLGQMYIKGYDESGHKGAPNYQEAFKWYKKAAERKDSYALYYLGLMHIEGYDESGHKGAPNYQEAVRWFQKAADQGYAAAQNDLGVQYHRGEGVSQDYDKAFEWYEKAANQGIKGAEYNLGWLYYQGEGVKKSYGKAFKLFQKAADQGYANAQHRLGWMYYYGEGIHDENHDKAFEWYEKAAKQGHAQAQSSLGWMYYYGEGVKKNYGKAFEWYEKAAKQGHVGAQYNLGRMYYKGYDASGHKGDPNYHEAFKWFQKAAKQKDAKAKKHLERLAQRGIAGAQDALNELEEKQ